MRDKRHTYTNNALASALECNNNWMQINFTLNQIRTEKKKIHLALITTETNKWKTSVMINHRLCKLDVGCQSIAWCSRRRRCRCRKITFQICTRGQIEAYTFIYTANTITRYQKMKLNKIIKMNTIEKYKKKKYKTHKLTNNSIINAIQCDWKIGYFSSIHMIMQVNLLFTYCQKK